MYDQARTDNYRSGGVQQVPYAQQSFYPMYYDDHSSRTSDSPQSSGGSFKKEQFGGQASSKKRDVGLDRQSIADVSYDY